MHLETRILRVLFGVVLGGDYLRESIQLAVFIAHGAAVASVQNLVRALHGCPDPVFFFLVRDPDGQNARGDRARRIIRIAQHDP